MRKIIWIIELLFFLMATISSFAIVILASLFGRNHAHYVIRQIIRPLFNLFFPYQVEGEDFISDSGGIILAGNHAGTLDTIVIEMACNRPVTFFAASWVERLRVIGWLAKQFKVIFVSRRRLIKTLDETNARLKSGELICIFPEGTPTPDGNILEFQRGVAYIHKKSKVPVVPFAIHGGYEAWPWRIGLPRFRKVIIQFGRPYCNYEGDEKVIADELQKKVQQIKDSIEKREKCLKYIRSLAGLRETTQLNGVQYNDNFLDLMQLKFNMYAPFKALSFKDKDEWKYLTYAELTRLSGCLASYFIEQGINRGDRIAILSESRPEWAVAFFASITSGAISVPLDIKLTYDELKPLVLNSCPSIICASPDLAEKANKFKAEIPSIKQVFIIDQSKCNGNLDSLYNLGKYSEAEKRERNPDETMMIVYTSGTTGNPKGVMVTFRNIVSQLKDFDRVFNFEPRESMVSILPLTHLLEITVGFITPLYRGGQITYTTSFHPQEFIKIMKEKKVTILVTVPAFLKVLKKGIEREIQKSDKVSRYLFKLLFQISEHIPSNHLRKLLFFKIHNKLGGNLRWFISGGASLEVETAEFFQKIGISVYQGYGLTETGPVISANTPKYNRLGSVGKPLPNVKVKISGEGEILTKGPNVMRGYYNRADLTGEAIDKEGWFHTGDIGNFDRDGYLYVTGRLKNVIVLSGGDKVQPEEVEEVLSRNSIIKEPCVIGVPVEEGPKKGSEEVVAVIIPTDELQKEYHNNIQGLKNEINKEVNKLSQSLSVYKRPDKVVLRMEDFPKTTTGKIKRKEVFEWYRHG